MSKNDSTLKIRDEKSREPSGLSEASVHSRRSPRRVFDRGLGVMVRGQYGLGRALQISEGGMMILAPQPLEKGQNILLTFFIPGEGHTVVRSEVLYERSAPGQNRASAYGVKFLNLELAIRRLIRNYVAAKTEEEASREAQS